MPVIPVNIQNLWYSHVRCGLQKAWLKPYLPCTWNNWGPQISWVRCWFMLVILLVIYISLLHVYLYFVFDMLLNYILKIFYLLSKILIQTKNSACGHKFHWSDRLKENLLADRLMYHDLHHGWYTDGIIMNASHSVGQYVLFISFDLRMISHCSEWLLIIKKPSALINYCIPKKPTILKKNDHRNPRYAHLVIPYLDGTLHQSLRISAHVKFIYS